jgi:hypothetical protein
LGLRGCACGGIGLCIDGPNQYIPIRFGRDPPSGRAESPAIQGGVMIVQFTPSGIVLNGVGKGALVVNTVSPGGVCQETPIKPVGITLPFR